MIPILNPKITHLKTGNKLKVLQVIGNAGMNVPEHLSTKEAVILVQKGEAVLKMEDVEYDLKSNETLIIPANTKHELKLIDDFEAIIIMEIDSEINFSKN